MDGHGVGGGHSVEEEDQQFADAVHEIHVLVGAGLLNERLDVAFIRHAIGAGGDVKQADRAGFEILGAEESGAVAGDFGLTLPFVERGDDGDLGGVTEADEFSVDDVEEG